MQLEGVAYTPETCLAAIPIVVDGVLRGSLVVTRIAGPPFRPDEITVLEDITAQVALALQAVKPINGTAVQSGCGHGM